jgi:immune inhibitor A
MDTSTRWVIVIVVVLLALCCCLILVASGAIGGLVYLAEEEGPIFETDPQPVSGGQGEEFPDQIGPPSDGAIETLSTLKNTIVPNNDLRDLAYRLVGQTDIPETMDGPAKVYDVGDSEDFWVTNMDTDENFSITTELKYETDHVYFWVEEGVDFDEDALADLVETFEDSIYPTNREFFGSEWSPGIDHDEHLYILFASGLGGSIAGYFSSIDSVHPLAHEYSNAHETFVMNADTVGLDERFTYGVLAHEFQHMIHWYRDRNESTWLNEGFAELAAFLNGYYEGGFDQLYIWETDMQLNDWPNNPNETTPHYGAAFLYVAYFLDRFGDEATQALVSHPNNGMDSVDQVLEDLDATDALSSAPVRADDVFADWAVTNYLNDSSVGDGRYAYLRYVDAYTAGVTETVSDCPLDWQTRSVNQYGVDYIRLDCEGSYTLRFEGVTEVGVLPENAYSGDYAFWSNKGDESDITLTQEFDFSDVTGDLTLSFQTWYDLEEGYDYLYFEASEDGETWEILITPSGTADDPSGNSYGWGYNGTTSGWINEEIDLSRFAGSTVYLRFEYVTDAAVNGEGLLLDDVSIPEIGYSTDFEKDDGGWEAAGFVRIQNRLPQTYRVMLIQDGNSTTVENMTLNELQSFSLPVDLGGGNSDTVLVVTATTRSTRQPAVYRFNLQP